MFLSRLQLNTGNRRVWRNIIANPYKLHQLVMRGFPNEVKRKEAKVLHRLESQDGTATLLVQSAIEPDWSMVAPNFLAQADTFHLFPNPAVKRFELPLQAGQALSFRLCANPTFKKVRCDESGRRRNSNRVPLVREDEQIAWLQNRAESSGFALLRVAVSTSQKQFAWKPKKGRPITIFMVQFEGYLRVTLPTKLTEAITTGIGPARAFGCGLLSLARANR